MLAKASALFTKGSKILFGHLGEVQKSFSVKFLKLTYFVTLIFLLKFGHYFLLFFLGCLKERVIRTDEFYKLLSATLGDVLERIFRILDL